MTESSVRTCTLARSLMNDSSNAAMTASSPAISLSGVQPIARPRRGPGPILKDIDLHIGRGEAIGLVGPSGSGKTTLLMVLAGLERADTGRIMVAGSDLRQLDEDALARFRGRNIGIVFQSFHLIPTMTALENVAVPLELAGHGDAQARAARGARHGRPRPNACHHYPAQLSGGEQQRRGARPRARARSRNSRGRRAHRQSRRSHRQADHPAAVRRPRRARHHAHSRDRTTTLWPSVATASSDCVRAGSRIHPLQQPQDSLCATDIVVPYVNRVPLWLKLVYTAFMAVLVPVYWYYYGPTNFLYFCDVSLLLTPRRHLDRKRCCWSRCARLAFVAVQTLWVADFVLNFFGVPLVGMTAYMFNHGKFAVPRSGVAVFRAGCHSCWIYLVWGFWLSTAAAFRHWTVLAWALMLTCFFLMPPPNPNAGLQARSISTTCTASSDAVAQTLVHPYVWLAGMLIGLPLLVHLPTHLVPGAFRAESLMTPKSV